MPKNIRWFSTILVVTGLLALACGQEIPPAAAPDVAPSADNRTAIETPTVAPAISTAMPQQESTNRQDVPAQTNTGAAGAGMTTGEAPTPVAPQGSTVATAATGPEPRSVSPTKESVEAEATPQTMEKEEEALTPQFDESDSLVAKYQDINLEEFGLNPDQPLAYQDKLLNQKKYGNHPYLHLFPNLQAHLKEIESGEQSGASQYHYYQPNTWLRGTGMRKEYTIESFLHHPWYEPYQASDIMGSLSLELDYGYKEVIRPIETPFFGKNSTREVLAGAVKELVKMSLPEDAEGIQFHPEGRTAAIKFIPPSPDNYLRIAITSSRGRAETPLSRTAHNPPIMSWGFVHQELPIVKVVADYEIAMPWRGEEDRAYIERTRGETTKPTKMTVGFVIAFQHRWENFSEPNRWALKYADFLTEWPEDQGTLPLDLRRWNGLEHVGWNTRHGTLDPSLDSQYPNYWHASDYMQHSLIGPVVLTVHESLTLKKGTYSVIPSVTHWEAPGPILRDQDLWAPPTIAWQHVPEGQEPERYQQKYPFFGSVNPGYPLPGHLLTMSYSQPGTKIWEFYDLGPEWEYPVP